MTLIGHNGVKDVPMPSRPLPLELELPVHVAATLKKMTCGSDEVCAVLGLAAPIVAVLHGAIAVMGVAESVNDEISLTISKEMSRMVKTVQPRGSVTAENSRALDVLLTWCATAIVPTYSYGVHLVLGDLDTTSEDLASDLAVVFKLACRRAQIDVRKEAPLLTLACQALIGHGTLTESMLRECIIQSSMRNPDTQDENMNDVRDYAEKPGAVIHRKISKASTGVSGSPSVSRNVSIDSDGLEGSSLYHGISPSAGLG